MVYAFNTCLLKPSKGLWFLFILVVTNCLDIFAQQVQQPGNGNPIIPGYFADPTVKKFGDTYYVYATTDGNGGGFGPSQVWVSKDFVNWQLQDMNWPTTHHYWAPDVTQGSNGKYYLYYCQPVEIFGASANTPVGPWTSLLPNGIPIVPNFLVPNVITLDGQTFKDDDGKYYMYWGTWGIYPNHGCGVGLLNPDMKSFEKTAQIPNTVAKDFFEAPFMFKRNGIYYLTYSSGYCEDGSYRVQYAMSKTGPMGPFVFGKNNPILTTSSDGTVHGPGHESVLQENDNFYMIYHRHNNPHAGGGYHRQIAADKMEFDKEGNIKTLVPTHTGIGFLGKDVNPHLNLALGAKVKASSFYSDDFKAEFAIDDNNGTLWKAKNNIGPATLNIDLGSIKSIKSIHTQFEYATWYYQYLIDYSIDNKTWLSYADKCKNTQHGSPMVDFKSVKARYVRLKILETEYPGLNKGIWNIKIFDNDEYKPATLTAVKKLEDLSRYHPKGLLVDLDASKFEIGETIHHWQNKGKLKGDFTALHRDPVTAIIAGKKAVVFESKSGMKSNFIAPLSLKGNSSFSVAMWLYNPDIAAEEPLLAWTARGGVDLTNASIGYGSHPKWGAASHWGWPDMKYNNLPVAGKWHHIALTFDGTMERLFVDGKLDHEERKMLFIDHLSHFFLAVNEDESAGFSGALANLKMYDIPLSAVAIARMAKAESQSHAAIYLNAASLENGPINNWKNEGYVLGSLTTNAISPIVGVTKGLMGITLHKENQLQFNRSNISPINLSKPFSFVMQTYADRSGKITLNLGKSLGILQLIGKEKWSNAMGVFDGKSFKLYMDGIAQKKIDLAKSLNNDFFIKAQNTDHTISAFYFYDYAFNTIQVKKQYQDWASNLSNETKTFFAEKPHAVSPAMISMSAAPVKLPGSHIQYQFTESHSKRKSGWINSADNIDYNIMENSHYTYTVQARDHLGNVSQAANSEQVSTALNLFDIKNDESDLHYDSTGKSISSTFWDGLEGKIDQLIKKDKIIKLASTKTFWDGAKPMGPFLFKNVVGDFIAEVKIDDLSGLKEKKANGANDVGLMVRSDTNKTLIQNSVMLGWNIGNITTNLNANGRKQENNASGWNFFPYLQIQRRGSVFYLRGSNDGKNWKELPGSPITWQGVGRNEVQVGLYQATYGENSGYGTFSNFSVIQQK
jgi:regulation of enolase protein 1 (concanavalin A-like superfamily)